MCRAALPADCIQGAGRMFNRKSHLLVCTSPPPCPFKIILDVQLQQEDEKLLIDNSLGLLFNVTHLVLPGTPKPRSNKECGSKGGYRRQYNLVLGTFLVERLFFPKNKRNDKERSHCSEKNERLERVLKNIGTIKKRTERNGNCLKRTVKIVNAFLLSRTRSKLGTHFKSGMYSKSSRNS